MNSAFDLIQKQLSLQSLGQSDKNFHISKQDYEDFCKEVIFEQLKGKKFGIAFCEKFDQTNYVLSMLNDEAAKDHVRKFYVK